MLGLFCSVCFLFLLFFCFLFFDVCIDYKFLACSVQELSWFWCHRVRALLFNFKIVKMHWSAESLLLFWFATYEVISCGEFLGSSLEVPGLCSRWQQLLGSIVEPNHNLQGTTCRRRQPKITQKVSQKSLSCTGVVQKVQSGAGWCPESTLKVVLGLDSFSVMGSFRSPLFEKSFQKFHFLPQKSTFAQIFCSPHNQARLILHLNIII